MPTKHIPDRTWRKVREATVDAVVTTKAPIKDTDVLNMLILKGLSEITKEDYKKLEKK